MLLVALPPDLTAQFAVAPALLLLLLHPVEEREGRGGGDSGKIQDTCYTFEDLTAPQLLGWEHELPRVTIRSVLPSHACPSAPLKRVRGE